MRSDVQELLILPVKSVWSNSITSDRRPSLYAKQLLFFKRNIDHRFVCFLLKGKEENHFFLNCTKKTNVYEFQKLWVWRKKRATLRARFLQSFGTKEDRADVKRGMVKFLWLRSSAGLTSSQFSVPRLNNKTIVTSAICFTAHHSTTSVFKSSALQNKERKTSQFCSKADYLTLKT